MRVLYKYIRYYILRNCPIEKYIYGLWGYGLWGYVWVMGLCLGYACRTGTCPARVRGPKRPNGHRNDERYGVMFGLCTKKLGAQRIAGVGFKRKNYFNSKLARSLICICQIFRLPCSNILVFYYET